MKRTLALSLTALGLWQTPLYAGDYQIIEHPAPPGQLLKDSFVVTYSANDFSEKLDEAKVIFIPADFRTQAAFFMRCRPYYTNFSVQYLEQADALKDRDGELANDAEKYAKHGYIYNTEHQLTVSTPDDSERIDVHVGGQNKHLTQLFKTDIAQTAGLLGMSFHFTFNYKEMPDFRVASNDSDTRAVFKLLNNALQKQTPLRFDLDGRNAPDRTFELNAQRMLQIVPPEVLEFCLTRRQLND
ncbi:hypothetical protein [Thiomicrorhabdus cannonii]|uniref:hypothetical protein n=1 Tax=Thiomicrorhabdus cannonii TaxID=2748011 RepID=UPI0015BCAB7B|nr:hypothetical protein [Thiomicrorhabdus cannonii]